jgi:hypothetical protein
MAGARAPSAPGGYWSTPALACLILQTWRLGKVWAARGAMGIHAAPTTAGSGSRIAAAPRSCAAGAQRAPNGQPASVRVEQELSHLRWAISRTPPHDLCGHRRDPTAGPRPHRDRRPLRVRYAHTEPGPSPGGERHAGGNSTPNTCTTGSSQAITGDNPRHLPQDEQTSPCRPAIAIRVALPDELLAPPGDRFVNPTTRTEHFDNSCARALPRTPGRRWRTSVAS